MSFVVGVDKKGTFSNCRDWSPEEHKGSCERGEREAVETDSCSRLSSGPQRSTPCARTCEYGSSCGERDFAEVNKDLEMGERRDRPESFRISVGVLDDVPGTRVFPKKPEVAMQWILLWRLLKEHSPGDAPASAQHSLCRNSGLQGADSGYHSNAG
ncbi:uncharacterized protein LOC118609963 isoform X6 [Rousettus aegyptiacus]|uniref:uncharacterized protein LOC118609963 isoform X6 n=1 Tax=Rousettus aegyptiacus TaxID=9407 RepID=UPI00168CB6FB|nr:uncharacterized protein LOC118609963 isoform X6 [Rousettus aegyptiacus]XP_036085141.1 uncharacterized protein LOC118609963 isoform X6 [Rousettus aegyptiacus]